MGGQTRNKPSNVFSEHFWRTLWRRFFGGGAKITAIAIRSDNRSVREDDCAADPVPSRSAGNLSAESEAFGDYAVSFLSSFASDSARLVSDPGREDPTARAGLALPLPEGAFGLDSFEWETERGIGYLLTYTVRSGVDRMGEYYRASFEKQGIQMAAYADADSINLIGGDDRLSLLVGISSDGNREGFATVTLSFGEKGTSLLRPRGRIVP